MYGFIEDVISTFSRNKKLVGYLNGLVLAGSLFVLLLLPKWYAGQATMIITGNSQFGALGALSDILPLGLLSNSGPNVDHYFVLAHSRKILDTLIVRYELNEMYDEPKYREDLYKALREDINLVENEDGSVLVECLYKDDPYKAAEMTNFLFEEMKRLSIEISNRQAKDFRIFIEGIYLKTVAELEVYEDSLRSFQEKHGLYNVDEQAKQMVGLLSEVQLQKIQLSSEKLFLEKYQMAGSSRLAEVNQKLKIVETQIKKIEQTTEFTGLALKELPANALVYLRIFRNLKIKEKILEFVIPQLEQAKLEEKKNTVEIYLLDKAVPQFKKVKPKRARLLVVIMISSILITYLGLKLQVWVRNNKDRLRELAGNGK